MSQSPIGNCASVDNGLAYICSALTNQVPPNYSGIVSQRFVGASDPDLCSHESCDCVPSFICSPHLQCTILWLLSRRFNFLLPNMLTTREGSLRRGIIDVIVMSTFVEGTTSFFL